MPPEIQSRINVIPPGDHGGIQARIRGTEVYGVTIPSDCTAVLVQRPTAEVLAKTLAHLSKEGVEIILEVDDDLEALPPQHPTYQLLKAMRSQDAVFPRLVASFANRVVVSTEALATKFQGIVKPGTPVYLARNRIPRDLIQDEWDREGPHVVGWPGAVNTHPGDLDVLGGAVARLGTGLRIVGGEDEKYAPKIGAPVTYFGRVEFEDWVTTLRSELTVGLVPLRDTPFNRAKSALKALELAAAGVPLVRPALPEFDKLDIGMAAEKPKHWYSLARYLLEDDALWNDHQTRGREIALQNTYEDHWGEFAEAWGL